MESTTTWLITLGVLSLVIVFDLALAIIRRNKETTMTEAGIWTVIYVAAAIVFGILMPNWTTDANAQKEFFAGWLTEYALSVDNIFVFVIILSRLQVEKTKQQLVLLLGIIIALVLRGGFIAAGSAIIEKLGIPNATLSFHLKELVAANLLLVERHSRNLIYRPNASLVEQLSDFLLDNCCGGKSCMPTKGKKKEQCS